MAGPQRKTSVSEPKGASQAYRAAFRLRRPRPVTLSEAFVRSVASEARGADTQTPPTRAPRRCLRSRVTFLRLFLRLPWWLRVKEPAYQCSGCGLDPWVRAPRRRKGSFLRAHVHACGLLLERVFDSVSQPCWVLCEPMDCSPRRCLFY